MLGRDQPHSLGEPAAAGGALADQVQAEQHQAGEGDEAQVLADLRDQRAPPCRPWTRSRIRSTLWARRRTGRRPSRATPRPTIPPPRTWTSPPPPPAPPWTRRQPPPG